MSDTLATDASSEVTPSPGTPGPAASVPLYDAFISYKQATESRLAETLRHGLHTFAKPWYRLRAARVFLDRSNLGGDLRLWQTIQTALGAAKHFIYLASPEAAASPWVQQELTQFLGAHPPERLIIILAAGEIEWDRAARDFDWSRTTAIPRLKQGLVTPDASPLSDLLYHDARWARGSEDLASDPRLRDLVATVSSTLRGIPKDTLAGQDVQLRRRALRLAWGAAVLLAVLAAAAGVAAWVARSQQKLAVQRLTRSYVANAMRLVDAGDPLSALPWLGAALDAEPKGAAGALHRERLAAVLRQTPRLVRRWTFSAPVRDVVLSRDGRRMAVVSGSEFNDPGVSAALGENELSAQAQVWDVETGRALTPPLRHNGGISSAAFSPDGALLLTASADSTAVLWDLRAPRAPPRHVLRHEAHVEHAEFSAGGARVLTIGAGIHVWNAADGSRAGYLPLPPDDFYSASIEPTGSVVAFGSPVRLWRVGSPSERDVPAFAGRKVEGVRFSPDGRRIVATESEDVRYTPEGRRIMELRPSAPGRNTVIQADAASGARTGPEIAMDARISAVVFSADGRKLATVGGSSVGGEIPPGLRVWDAASGAPLTRWLTHPYELNSASFSADGRWVIAIGWDGMVRMWSAQADTAGDPRLTAPIRHDGGVVAARLLPDARRLVTASRHEVRLWDLVPPDPRPAPEARAPAGAPVLLDGARSRDGRWTAELGGAVRAGPGSRDVVVRDARGPEGGHMLVFPEIVRYLRISPDGRLLAVGGELGSVWLWDLRRGAFRLGRPLPHGARDPAWLEFSPDSRTLATVGDHARVWDVRTGAPLTPPLLHAPSGRNPFSVSHAAFNAAGTRIATVGYEGTVRVWDAGTGDPLTGLLGGARTPVEYAWFSRDGRTLYAAGIDDQAPLAWSLAPETRPAGEARRAAELLSSLRIDEVGALVPANAAGGP